MRKEGFDHWSTGFNTECSECLEAFGICCTHKAKAMLKEGEITDELASFSKQPCDICNNKLAGDRHAAHALDENKELNHFEVCTDCALIINGG